MIKFKDRKSAYINRRRLVVQNTEKNLNGDITALTVDIYREEGTVTEAGTKLNNIELNFVFNNALEFLFKQHFTLQDNLTVSWTQEQGFFKTKTFRIDTPQMLYGKVADLNSYISGTVSSYANYMNVNISETLKLNNRMGLGSEEFVFYVELYSDASFSKYITRFKGIVNYFYSSTNPSD